MPALLVIASQRLLTIVSTRERCDICGKAGVVRQQIPRTHGRSATLLVVEDVPVTVCSSCGESYLKAETLQEVEQLVVT